MIFWIAVGAVVLVAINHEIRHPNFQLTGVTITPGSHTIQTSSPYTAAVGNSSKPFVFNYTNAGPATTYLLVFDNSADCYYQGNAHFCRFFPPTNSTKSVTLSYTIEGATGTRFFVLGPGANQTLQFDVTQGGRLYGKINVTGNDMINFYMLIDLCIRHIDFSYQLLNSGFGDGSATVRIQADRETIWESPIFVAQHSSVHETGTAQVLGCGTHNYTAVIQDITESP